MNKKEECLEVKLVPWGGLNVGKQKGVVTQLTDLGYWYTFTQISGRPRPGREHPSLSSLVFKNYQFSSRDSKRMLLIFFN